MRNFPFSFFLIQGLALLMFLGGAVSLKAQYKIGISLPQHAGQEVYLGYYYSNDQYITDTITLNRKGKGEFRGKESLPQGLYMIITPGMKFFDFIVGDDQSFSLQNDTNDLILNFKCKGSKENEILDTYQKYFFNYKKEVQELERKAQLHPDSFNHYSMVFEGIHDELDSFKLKLATNNPGTLAAALLRAMTDPILPDSLKVIMTALQNKGQQLYYLHMRDHYFDHIDFSDSRLLYSSILVNRIDNYLQNILMDYTDTIIDKVTDLIELSRPYPETFRFVLEYLAMSLATDGKYTNEEAFVAVCERYYLSGIANWTTSEFLASLNTKIDLLKNTLLGKNPPRIELLDTSGADIHLDSLSGYSLLMVFWDPECEHCVEYVGQIQKVTSQAPPQLLTVLAILTNSENQESWKKYINQNPDLWIHGRDKHQKDEFIDSYNLYMTPRVFLLDDKRQIIGKDLSPYQLNDYIQSLFR
jgi:hypothetical protein